MLKGIWTCAIRKLFFPVLFRNNVNEMSLRGDVWESHTNFGIFKCRNLFSTEETGQEVTL
jgi:hypothetical protein